MPPSDTADPKGPIGVPDPIGRLAETPVEAVGGDAATAQRVAAAIAERDWFADERDAAITEQYRLMQERDTALAEASHLAAELRAAHDEAERTRRQHGRQRAAPTSTEATEAAARFAAYQAPVTEAEKAYRRRLESGFLIKYCRGELVLDVGHTGRKNPDNLTSLPGAIGVDLDYPGYDGVHLPWPDASVDCIFASHCLEHVEFYQKVIRDWHRALKVGGFIVCMVPSRDLYEKKRFPPSRYNQEHHRFYTPSRLAAEFEEALEVNSFRIRHLYENDQGYDYRIGPEQHADGCYEIEIVVEKIAKPKWTLE
jgi:SAM-dependent methyltransferase